MTTIAIHQPNLFPWLGYFDKIVRADRFVILDDVQFPKTGGTYMNRVQLCLAGRPQWVTAPVERTYHGVRSVAQMVFDDRQPWRRKLLASIRSHYGRAPGFGDVFPLVEAMICREADSIAAWNIANLLALLDALDLPRNHLVLASELDIGTQSTQRLIDIIQRLGGDTYLCGGGAVGYQQDELFAAAGLRVLYQGFRHPVYRQAGAEAFLPGLSIVDVMMNLGRKGAMLLFQQMGKPIA